MNSYERAREDYKDVDFILFPHVYYRGNRCVLLGCPIDSKLKDSLTIDEEFELDILGRQSSPPPADNLTKRESACARASGNPGPTSLPGHQIIPNSKPSFDNDN